MTEDCLNARKLSIFADTNLQIKFAPLLNTRIEVYAQREWARMSAVLQR
ncbi:hypothetical protein SAMN05444680_103365 [Variovorax sp. YR216]|nr:hypothetical protein SAMN05444680_103365 [Variovorax sp. YR216]